jgi:hypothetical protein
MLEALLGQSEVCSGVSVSLSALVLRNAAELLCQPAKIKQERPSHSRMEKRFVLALSSRCVERATKHTQETSMTMANGITVRRAFGPAGVKFFGENG